MIDPSAAPQVTCPVCGKTSRVFKDKDTDRVFCPVCQFPTESKEFFPLDDISIHKFLKMVKKPVMILFWAPWDKESENMLNLLQIEMENKPEKIIVTELNISENPESRRHYGIKILPTLLIFAFGREVNRIVGPVSSFEIFRLMNNDYFF
jgi:thiol-disulfide isomerase/thioredoxin